MKEKFVEMLVDSAEHMHRMVIAEGVEVYDHILYLEKNNIQYGQGYYFSKPFEDKFVYSVGIHAPDFSNKNMKEKHPGDRQVHAHIMICLKEIDLENPMNFEQFLKHHRP